MTMNRLIMLICVCLASASVIFAQSENPTVSHLRNDYNQVSTVARVRILNAKVVDMIGNERSGYYLYSIRSQVIEPLKGRIKKRQPLEFYLVLEKGADINWFLGEKIVFLDRSDNSPDKKMSLFALENSTLPASKQTIARLRNIKNRSRRN
jgi:hypothetical protein